MRNTTNANQCKVAWSGETQPVCTPRQMAKFTLPPAEYNDTKNNIASVQYKKKNHYPGQFKDNLMQLVSVFTELMHIEDLNYNEKFKEFRFADVICLCAMASSKVDLEHFSKYLQFDTMTLNEHLSEIKGILLLVNTMSDFLIIMDVTCYQITVIIIETGEFCRRQTSMSTSCSKVTINVMASE